MRIEMGLDLGDDDAVLGVENFDGVLDRRRGTFEYKIDHRPADCGDPSLELPRSHRNPLQRREPAFLFRTPRDRPQSANKQAFIDFSAEATMSILAGSRGRL